MNGLIGIFAAEEGILAERALQQADLANLIFIADVPVCKSSEPVVHGVGKGEMVDVLCDVVANPNVDGFNWAFNNSAGLIHVPASRATVVNGTRSKLTYTPRNNKDYGTLMCEAKNEVGRQKQPCIFHIILAGTYVVVY